MTHINRNRVIVVYILGNGGFRVLLPFGVPFGDEVILPGLFSTSGPQSKLAISNITCPFFGTSEDTIFVSASLLMV